MGGRVFREGDKVFYYDSSDDCFKYGIYERPAEREQAKITLGLNGEFGNTFVDEKHLYHDDQRMIHTAVQKAIVENETKPVRKVKRWFNLFVDNFSDCRFLFYESKEEAEKQVDPDYRYFKIAHEIEIEEDKL